MLTAQGLLYHSSAADECSSLHIIRRTERLSHNKKRSVMIQLTSGHPHTTTPLVQILFPTGSFPNHPQKDDTHLHRLGNFQEFLLSAAQRMRSTCLWSVSLMLTSLWCILPVPVEAAAIEIAILKSSDLMAYNEAIEGFKATAPGAAIYTEYDLRGDLERGKQLARKIRASTSSLVVAVGLKAALAAKLESLDIPVLYTMILDPLKHGLTASNMTGVLPAIPMDRQFRIMRSLLPTLHRIGVLYDPTKTASKLKEAAQQAAGSDFQLQGFPVENEKEISQQLRMLVASSEALWLIPDSTVLTDESIRFLIESALAKQVPVIGFSSEFTRLGALASLSVNYSEIGRETGLLAKRILDGDKPLPSKPISVQRVSISVNQKTARYLGIAIPKELDSLIDETY
ncbi:MAG: ABC transporter substrate-binding protein [Nitrospira sp.]|nr:ABC transporter substrate-binding protein [Nitrospira sp.]MDH4371442.1 ABC transporter substrate-binding protein [Nitrospira sp.]MDH5349004.1 ABC transporter substrate-binding protein [Nitrospira sp.]MDH5499349.1 ABC transporter substrate-binding protein [Nitrospira sp.]